jgi:tRNA(adenine34) deaminase
MQLRHNTTKSTDRRRLHVRFLHTFATMTDVHYMQMALKEAKKAFDAGEVPVGAVIIQQERILAKGFNQVETLNDSTAHAEIIALTSAFNFLGSKYLTEATIYITVEPCLMCAGALYWSKIGRIVYGAPDEKNGYRRSCGCPAPADANNKQPWPFHPKTELTTNVMAAECGLLMKDFFKARR